MTDFDKHPGLIVQQEQPFNAEPPLSLLRQHAVTPTELFFVRNHGTVPQIDADQFCLRVGGMVDQPLTLRLDELQERFAIHTIEATLQCAGNRRVDMMAVAPTPGEVPWNAGALSNGLWRGVRLHDVLAAAGVDRSAQHVAFAGADEVTRLGRTFGLGGSIPLPKALRGDVLLAFGLNDAPLPPMHGGPLRVIAPGYIGARSVKWLIDINVQMEPSDNYFQAHAYKLFSSTINAANVDWNDGLMLGELSLNSVICVPAPDATLPAGTVVVQGFATAGGERTIARVDLSADGGATWLLARLDQPVQPGVWCLWTAELDLAAGEHELIVRAVDSAANMQPERAASVWNFKGYMHNAWHRVCVRVG